MLERMRSQGNTPPLLVGVQTFTASLEINVTISQKITNQSVSKPSDTTSWNDFLLNLGNFPF